MSFSTSHNLHQRLPALEVQESFCVCICLSQGSGVFIELSVCHVGCTEIHDEENPHFVLRTSTLWIFDNLQKEGITH